MPDKENINNNESGNWTSWKMHVVKSIDRLERKQNDCEREFHDHEIEATKNLAEIKTKMGIIGVISGAIVSIIISVIAGLIIYSITGGPSIDTNKNTKEIEEIINNLENK